MADMGKSGAAARPAWTALAVIHLRTVRSDTSRSVVWRPF
jgi:hypothetical protein